MQAPQAAPNSTYNMRTFYTLVLTQVLSLIGTRITGLAVGFWIFAQTQDATPLALVSFFFILPQVVLSGLAGVLADRWDRRYVMVLADAGQAVGSLLLFISFASGAFQLWHLYAVVVMQSLFAVFQGPAFQASVTMLVPDTQRDRANALQQLTGPLAGIIAPAIAGLIYAAVGVTGAIAIEMVTFAIAVGVVLLAHIPRPPRTAEGAALDGTVWKQMFDGFRYLWARQPLFWLVLYFAVINLLAAGLAAIQLPYFMARTGSEATTGLLSSVINVGALAGGIIMSIWGGTRPRIHTVMIGVMVAAVFLVGLGMAQQALLLGLMAFLFMFPLPMVNAAIMSIMQNKVAPDVQGRVFAAIGQFSMLMMPISFLLVGPLADTVFEPLVGTPGWATVAPLVGGSFGAGMGLMMVISGITILVLSALVYSVPAIRRVEANLPDFAPAAAPESQPEPEPQPRTATGEVAAVIGS